MIAWIITLIDILIIFYYVKYTYYYNHIGKNEEKVIFPVWIILLAIFVSCIPVARYLALVGLVIVAPIAIITHNDDSYNKIKVKGFLTKGI